VLRRFEGDLARALAAYNAGASRVTTWNGTGAARDPELFIERITIPETRDYVRIIQRNLTLYRALYRE
jgi:soluble lytic murein transglycosylase